MSRSVAIFSFLPSSNAMRDVAPSSQVIMSPGYPHWSLCQYCNTDRWTGRFGRADRIIDRGGGAQCNWRRWVCVLVVSLEAVPHRTQTFRSILDGRKGRVTFRTVHRRNLTPPDRGTATQELFLPADLAASSMPF